MGGYLLVNTGPTRRAPDDALDPPNAQPRASVGREERAADAATEMNLQELPEIRGEEDQPVLAALALANPEGALTELDVGDVQAGKLRDPDRALEQQAEQEAIPGIRAVGLGQDALELLEGEDLR
jgi:hypothetical protein